MNAIDRRARFIHIFTVPRHHVAMEVVRQYAFVAAQWERLRLLEHQVSVLFDEEHFLNLSAILQRFSTDLGVQTCTVNSEGADGVAGITDRRGFLPYDPAYLHWGTWHEATEAWCKEI